MLPIVPRPTPSRQPPGSVPEVSLRYPERGRDQVRDGLRCQEMVINGMRTNVYACSSAETRTTALVRIPLHVPVAATSGGPWQLACCRRQTPLGQQGAVEPACAPLGLIDPEAPQPGKGPQGRISRAAWRPGGDGEYDKQSSAWRVLSSRSGSKSRARCIARAHQGPAGHEQSSDGPGRQSGTDRDPGVAMTAGRGPAARIQL
jgi:hypothetical protein